ncbi:hypothetical protein NT2_02_00260 [Caenibius tardaugens NBRC 16725]|uniref:Uncharacterized protein n=1 Tax=Caenibius tardaugens NBRC 16725 TaxID=1219035 RepID=U2ZZJ5_9SPHN|nr:hypothetical protein [Caenibius tardaugens]AZI37972.1 hypothetical protein EGO55_20035 [Caenibius tardaugens NBRC 16725]GAD47943.1 hypothetical protein NT2_02_00260 [Caenibius tardaugens NBRC 16725]
MRVALLSMLDSAGEPGQGYRAFIPFAGKTVARRQIDVVLALGCERVICLADNLGPGLIALQHQVEGAGAKFHVISVPRALCGLVHASDELIILGDGVLPLADEAREILAKGNGVLVLPAETGIPAGFERIDLNYAWAGALAMPGKLVDRLNELPRDCDGIAALLRIALQSKVPELPLPDAVLNEGRWAMLGGLDDAHALEPGWFRRHASGADIFSPGRWMACGLTARFGVAWLNRGVRPGYLLLAAALLLIGAVALGWNGMVGAGFALLGGAWLAYDAARSLEHGERAGNASDRLFTGSARAWAAIADLALVMLVAMGIDESFSRMPVQFFEPLALLGLVWLIPGVATRRWGAILGDRVVVAGLLALAMQAGVLESTVQCLILILIGCGILFMRLGLRITQI